MKRFEIELSLDECHDEELLRKKIANKAKMHPDELPPLNVLKRSLDARRGRVRFHLLVEFLESPLGPMGLPRPIEVDPKSQVIIVGDGPAGLFCAYELARAGIRSIVIERGKEVQPRRKDLKGLNQHGVVDANSNYCFGEGGAGTYSDGKLYTRAHKRGDIRDIIEILAYHGAPERILSDARPHIGSNKLPVVIQSMRNTLESCGVEFLFGAKVDGFVWKDKSVIGVIDERGNEVIGEAVVLATGHSGRNIFSLLNSHNIAIEAKTFALGVRVEHPQPLINEIQYGNVSGHPALPPASYRLAHQEKTEGTESRGVYSFCMCPGGWIVPASTEAEGVVVNGMSLSKRDSPFANSGVVVSITPDDVAKLGYKGPLAGIDLQAALEKKAYDSGGGRLKAPAVRVSDFMNRKSSKSLPKTSYIPGIEPADMDTILNVAGDDMANAIRRGFKHFDTRLRGYVTDEAIMVGVESRTSSPIRILRDDKTFESTSTPGLYPCGEGAGFAGGIVSAAMDGLRVARSLVSRLGNL